MDFKIPYGHKRKLILSVTRRDRKLTLSVRRRYPEKMPQLLVPCVPVADVINLPTRVTFIDVGRIDGNTSLAEQVVILSLAAALESRTVFEFGTFDGRSAANLAINLDPDAKIMTIDLPARDMADAALPIGQHDVKYIMKEASGGKFKGIHNVTQLWGDTAKFDFSPWFGQCDLVFVDACHAYEYVLNDSEIALRLIRPGGVVLWHDYAGFAGVTRALNQLFQQDSRFAGLRHIDGTSLCVLRT